MEMPNINLLSITPIYIALLGILFVPFTMRVGLYRVKNEIIIGDGKDEELIRHALFNAVGPIVNVIALNLAWLVGGVVVIEQIFSYPGLAKLMIEAVQMRDMPLVQACAMIFCATYIVLIFIADISSILSNPRLRHPK